MPVRLLRSLYLAVLLLLLVPAAALAVGTSPTLVLPGKQLWVLIIGALVPLLTYVLNHVGPWVTEPIKALVLLVVSAIASGLYAALATNNFGFNSPTLELVVSGIVAALLAHKLLWLPSGLSTILGGGTNRQAPVAVAKKPKAVSPAVHK